MPSSDPVGDMIAMIKNANHRHLKKVGLPHSRLKEGVASALRAEGYLEDVKVVGDEKRPERKTLFLFLKYDVEGVPVISEIKRVSKPGRRVFRGVDNLGKVLDGLGTTILSTSRGVVSDRQAKKQRLGGELICKVW